MREQVGERLCRELDHEQPDHDCQDINPYLDDAQVLVDFSESGVERAVATVAGEMGLVEKPRFKLSRDFDGPIVSIPEFAIRLQRDAYEQRWMLQRRMEETELDAMFALLNREFFLGQLPHYRVRWSKKTRFHSPMLLEAGRIHPEQRLIELSTALRTEAAARRTLLHEMCHQPSATHGGRFLVKLHKLANHGERWARDQEEYYRRTEVTWNATMTNIRQAMDQALEPNQGRQMTLQRFISKTAEEMGTSRKSLLQRAPWIPAAWRKAKHCSLNARSGEVSL